MREAALLYAWDGGATVPHQSNLIPTTGQGMSARGGKYDPLPFRACIKAA